METRLEEVEKCPNVTHSDSNREDVLGDCDRIEPVNAPEKQLDVSEPSFGEVKGVVKKARTASAPGHNAIPYKVYQDVLTTSQAVMEALERSLEEGDVPASWKEAEGIFTRRSTSLEQSRCSTSRGKYSSTSLQND